MSIGGWRAEGVLYIRIRIYMNRNSIPVENLHKERKHAQTLL